MNKAKAYFVLALACVLWGGTPACGKVLVSKMPPLTLTGVRFFLMAAFIFLFLSLTRKGRAEFLPHGARAWFVIFLLGLTGVYLHNTVLMIGLNYTTASNTALIESIGPTVTSVLAFLVIGERLSPKGWLGIAISCAGAICIVVRGSLDALLSMDINKGDIIVLFAESMWSVYTIISWYLPSRVGSLCATAWSGLIGSAMCLSTAAAVGDLRCEDFGLDGLFSMVYMVFGSGIAAFVGWNWGVQRVGASKTGVFVYIVPVAGALMGFLFLGERLLPAQMAGGAIILMGMVLTMRSKTASRRDSRSVIKSVKKKAAQESAVQEGSAQGGGDARSRS
ncbi:MAG: DMT family transporter [Succinivibrio sp.]